MTRARKPCLLGDLITVPVVAALLILTAILDRFELMPRMTACKPRRN